MVAVMVAVMVAEIATAAAAAAAVAASKVPCYEFTSDVITAEQSSHETKLNRLKSAFVHTCADPRREVQRRGGERNRKRGVCTCVRACVRACVRSRPSRRRLSGDDRCEQSDLARAYLQCAQECENKTKQALMMMRLLLMTTTVKAAAHIETNLLMRTSLCVCVCVCVCWSRLDGSPVSI